MARGAGRGGASAVRGSAAQRSAGQGRADARGRKVTASPWRQEAASACPPPVAASAAGGCADAGARSRPIAGHSPNLFPLAQPRQPRRTRRHVGGGVAKAAVALLHNQRNLLALRGGIAGSMNWCGLSGWRRWQHTHTQRDRVALRRWITAMLCFLGGWAAGEWAA